MPGIRVDAGVRDGSVVSVHYDPMLAKVIAHAPTREQAARLLARALAEARLHGVVTNRDLLTGILREPEFLGGRTDTSYLTRHDPADLMAADPRRDEIHALAVALADQAFRRETAAVLRSAPSGWRNVRNGSQQVTYAVGGRTLTVAYQLSGDRAEVSVQVGDAPNSIAAPDSGAGFDAAWRRRCLCCSSSACRTWSTCRSTGCAAGCGGSRRPDPIRRLRARRQHADRAAEVPRTGHGGRPRFPDRADARHCRARRGAAGRRRPRRPGPHRARGDEDGAPVRAAAGRAANAS